MTHLMQQWTLAYSSRQAGVNVVTCHYNHSDALFHIKLGIPMKRRGMKTDVTRGGYDLCFPYTLPRVTFPDRHQVICRVIWQPV